MSGSSARAWGYAFMFIAIAIALSVTVFPFIWNRLNLPSPIGLDLQLTFRYTGTYNDQVIITYSWSGDAAENRSGELTFEWRKNTSTGEVGAKISRNEVDEVIISYFSTLTAENNILTINSLGEWVIQTALLTRDGFSLYVGFEGDSESIQQFYIGAELDLLPSELKSQLKNLGIVDLELSAKAVISINPEFWEWLINLIISFIKKLIETFERIVDAIQL